ncbi:MAG TPA: TIGR02757 family protein [Myxococcaceae bacterium]|nr:TIGR02757 family protein [Myxococcaceae bacterium]
MRGDGALSAPAAARLGPVLETLLDAAKLERRVAFDPVELPRRYRDPRDAEVAGLLCASLAYGRVELFKPKLQTLLEAMGPSPAQFVRALETDPAALAPLLKGFVYRFNVGTDVAVLLAGMGRALARHGSLEGLFLAQLECHPSYREALGGFTSALREVPMDGLRVMLGPERGLDHLLPRAPGPGAAKRLNLFLRWMVRGPDAVDLGLWRRVPTARLIIPLDTHVGRLSSYLGLTRRRDLSWKAAEEITASLRQLDPLDPVKYDFALCHHGMSGACPAEPRAEDCQRCPLARVCRLGRRRLSVDRKAVTP